MCRSEPSLSRQQLHLTLVSAACELLGPMASIGGQAGSREAALQLLPAITLAGRGVPAAAMSQATARHGRSLDAFQALQRSEQAVCWVGYRRNRIICVTEAQNKIGSGSYPGP